VALNFGKCDFAKSSFSYLGHMISAQGIEADLAKVEAIMEMEQPTNVGDIQRFLGMINERFSEQTISVDKGTVELTHLKR